MSFGLHSSKMAFGLLLTVVPIETQANSLEAARRACRDAATAINRVIGCDTVIAHGGQNGDLARAYNRRGHANVELGRYLDAVRDFSVVIRLNPDVAGYYDNRQNALRLAGRLPEALRDADAAVRLAPSYTFVFRSRANIYYDMGRDELAIEDYTRAINLDSNDASLRADRAKVHIRSLRTNEAYVDLTAAISIDPANATYLRDRGLLLARSGERGAAQADLRAYLARQPEDVEASKALAALDKALSSPTPAPAETDPRETEAMSAKKKLVSDAVAQHEACLLAGLADIVPHSTEAAPTIADVVFDGCAKFAEQRISIGVAAFDLTREQATEIVKTKVAELRTKMISAIVTTRAEIAKKQGGSGSDAPINSRGLPKAQPL